jgi:hypothetical protein
MGVLKNMFRRNVAARLSKLPSGAFSLDSEGHLIVSTLPSSFSDAQMREIGSRVLSFFRNAQRAQVAVQELNIYYPSLKVTARNLRGGAIIFLSPQSLPKN